MKLPRNIFKQRMLAGVQQIGIWNSLGGGVVPELLACAKYDWILVDTEHSPIEVAGVLPILQSIAAYSDTAAVVRPAANDAVLIKRHLDQGAQTLLIPFVQSRDEAKAAVEATRYPPEGIRGVAGLTRASRFGQVQDYAQWAAQELCVIVQVETIEAVAQLEEIASTQGVDAVFIGPGDLAASLGHAGEPGHPDVIKTIDDIITRLQAINKPSGILSTNVIFARNCLKRGVSFVAAAVDSGLLMNALVQNQTEMKRSLKK